MARNIDLINNENRIAKDIYINWKQIALKSSKQKHIPYPTKSKINQQNK